MTGELLDALERVATATDTDQLEESVLRATLATARGDSAAVTSLDPRERPARAHPVGFFSIAEQSRFGEIHRASPWVLATHTQVHGGQPLRISDRLSQRRYRSLAIYGDLFRSLEIDHQVAFSVPLPDHASLCVVVNRSRTDFTDAELDSLSSLRTTLIALTRSTYPRDRLAIERVATLTDREAAILSLVSAGLSNALTAVQLGISERTVNKHLEHIYTKLNVTNRTAAAALWHRSRAG